MFILLGFEWLSFDKTRNSNCHQNNANGNVVIVQSTVWSPHRFLCRGEDRTHYWPCFMQCHGRNPFFHWIAFLYLSVNVKFWIGSSKTLCLLLTVCDDNSWLSTRFSTVKANATTCVALGKTTQIGGRSK